jgi:cytoskeletal protein RodZ
MNKLYRLPLRTRTKNLSSGVRRRQNSSKILATGILALCGLAALVAIGFAAFLTYKHTKGKPKVAAVASPTPAPTPETRKDILLPLSDPNKAPADGTAAAQPAVSPQSSPSVLLSSPVPTPAPTPAASVVQHPQRTDAQGGGTDKPLTKAARKTLERKRLEAEHKRAQLEKMYQSHEISTDAYNKGKEEYKAEIQKYREALKSGI